MGGHSLLSHFTRRTLLPYTTHPILHTPRYRCRWRARRAGGARAPLPRPSLHYLIHNVPSHQWRQWHSARTSCAASLPFLRTGENTSIPLTQHEQEKHYLLFCHSDGTRPVVKQRTGDAP